MPIVLIILFLMAIKTIGESNAVINAIKENEDNCGSYDIAVETQMQVIHKPRLVLPFSCWYLSSGAAELLQELLLFYLMLIIFN